VCEPSALAVANHAQPVRAHSELGQLARDGVAALHRVRFRDRRRRCRAAVRVDHCSGVSNARHEHTGGWYGAEFARRCLTDGRPPVATQNGGERGNLPQRGSTPDSVSAAVSNIRRGVDHRTPTRAREPLTLLPAPFSRAIETDANSKPTDVLPSVIALPLMAIATAKCSNEATECSWSTGAPT
jgi:hypothetical protein